MPTSSSITLGSIDDDTHNTHAHHALSATSTMMTINGHQRPAGRVLMNHYLMRLVLDELRGMVESEIEEEDGSVSGSNSGKAVVRSHVVKEFRRLMVTSKAFWDAAANHVWEHLDSLLPLLKLFPGFQKQGGGNANPGPGTAAPAPPTYYMFRMNEPGARDRFDAYARRVRSFTFPDFNAVPCNISNQVYVQLAMQLAGAPLLPCLHEIRVERLDEPTSPAFLLVMSSSVRIVQLRNTCLSKSAISRTIWERLAESEVEIITVILKRMRAEGKSIPWDAVSRIHRLKRFELKVKTYNLETDALMALKRLPDLQSLLLGVASMPTPLNTDPGFGCITRLKIPLGSGPLPRQLELIPMQTVLHAHLDLLPELENESDVWNQLAVHLPRNASAMRTLTFTSVGKAQISFDNIETLLRIPRVEKLIFGRTLICNNRGLTTADVDERVKRCLEASAQSTARGLPLAELHLPRLVLGPAMSFASLLHLAQHGKHIARARLTIDSSTALPPAIPAGAQSHMLQQLIIIDARKEAFRPAEYNQIALFIDGLFPKLQVLMPVYDPLCLQEAPLGILVKEALDHREHWKVVEKLRKYAKMVRERC